MMNTDIKKQDNQMNINVSHLTELDRQDWEQLYRGYAEFYKMPMEQTTLDTVWSWIHNEQKEFYGLIAKDEQNQALGLMHCRAMPSPLRGSEVGFLDDLFVVPEARGTGVVEALYAELNNFGNQQGWPLIRWITAENNYRGRNLYDKISEKTAWVTYQLAIK